MPSSTFSSANGSEYFWPNIKKAIMENPGGQPPSQRMKPECPICLETFSITTFRRPSRNAPRCMVLFCGHVVCKECLETNQARSEGAPKPCPYCQTQVACTSCGKASEVFKVPDATMSPDAVFTAPLTKPENPNGNARPQCHNCTASGEWLGRIDNGDWPREAETIEPGAGRFMYGAASALEAQGRPVTPAAVTGAFQSVVNDEFQTLMARRNDFISQRRTELQNTNPWFTGGRGTLGGDRETGGQDRYGSSSHHHERRREVNIFDYQDPPSDEEARYPRGEFEERRRMHDRLPEETSLQNQLAGLNLGGEQRFDPFGRPQRRDGRRGHAQQRFDDSDSDEYERQDAGMGGMTNNGGFRGGRETGRDAFPGGQYGRDTGSFFSETQRGGDAGRNSRVPGTQRETDRDAFFGGRNTGNPYSGNGAPYKRDADFLPSGTRGGGNAGRDNRFPSAQRETSPERGRETTGRRYQYGRETSEDRAINAEFERNPAAQKLFRKDMEEARASGIFTEQEMASPRYVTVHREIAINEAKMRAQWAQEDRERANRGDGPSERRWE